MRLDKNSLKKRMLGTNEKTGIIPLAAIYFLLIAIGFVYLYPVLYMVVNSFMSPDELADVSVNWVPRNIYFGNFVKAFETLDFGKSFLNSLIMSAGPTVLQVLVTACIGFGLARFAIKGKAVWMILIVSTFLIPDQIVKIPRYVLYHSYGILETVWPFYLPAALGQGLKSAIFILIFYQFFASYPKALDEAAEIDGCSKFRIFYQIAMPTAIPAVVLSAVASFVWYWNETAQSTMFFSEKIPTLPIQLGIFTDRYTALYGATDTLSEVDRINEAVTLAGTLLSVLPLIILYLVLQRKFMQSVEMTGIAGE